MFLPSSDPQPATAIPTFFVGIDVSKSTHMAAFLSPQLLRERKKHMNMPVLPFQQSRTGIDALLKAIRHYGGELSSTAILLEQTGHYHRPLQEALLAEGLRVFVIAVHQKKLGSLDKTDKRDALRLANMLYTQVALDARVDDSTQEIRQLLPPVPVAATLSPLVRMRYEKTQQKTRLRNKLTAICDQVFPELTEIAKDPNLTFALELRSRFPTPGACAQAPFEQLQALKHGNRPSDAHLLELQRLASQSIGVKDESRLHGLLLEQEQLIAELLLVNSHLSRIDQEIHELIASSREGQILMSLPAMGVIDAAALLAVIGNIRNFEKASHLRRFLGWAPQSMQTGVSYDRDTQTGAGSRLGKIHLYLLTIRATRTESWKPFYERLILKKCSYDSRIKSKDDLKKYRGKMKVIGRLAGTLAGMIFAFLKADADLVDRIPEGWEPPDPKLYDPAVHQAHRRGERHASSL